MMDFSSSSPYQILGLPSDAPVSQVRKAYRRLAMRYHPDRNPDDPEAGKKFKQVQWAYEALIGTKKKACAPCGQAQYESYSRDVHPFTSFFKAARAHYAKKRD